MEGDGVELSHPALSRLMQNVVSKGREFNTVLVWNHSRSILKGAEFAGLWWTLRENGIDLVLATDSPGLGDFEHELDGLTDALGDEAAG